MNNASQLDGIPVARLSAEEIPLEHQFEVWKQAASPLFDVIPMRNTRSFSCSAASYRSSITLGEGKLKPLLWSSPWNSPSEEIHDRNQARKS